MPAHRLCGCSWIQLKPRSTSGNEPGSIRVNEAWILCPAKSSPSTTRSGRCCRARATVDLVVLGEQAGKALHRRLEAPGRRYSAAWASCRSLQRRLSWRRRQDHRRLIPLAPTDEQPHLPFFRRRRGGADLRRRFEIIHRPDIRLRREDTHRLRILVNTAINRFCCAPKVRISRRCSLCPDQARRGILPLHSFVLERE